MKEFIKKYYSILIPAFLISDKISSTISPLLAEIETLSVVLPLILTLLLLTTSLLTLTVSIPDSIL